MHDIERSGGTLCQCIYQEATELHLNTKEIIENISF
jgi:hypothetical protein